LFLEVNLTTAVDGDGVPRYVSVSESTSPLAGPDCEAKSASTASVSTTSASGGASSTGSTSSRAATALTTAMLVDSARSSVE